MKVCALPRKSMGFLPRVIFRTHFRRMSTGEPLGADVGMGREGGDRSHQFE